MRFFEILILNVHRLKLKDYKMYIKKMNFINSWEKPLKRAVSVEKVPVWKMLLIKLAFC